MITGGASSSGAGLRARQSVVGGAPAPAHPSRSPEQAVELLIERSITLTTDVLQTAPIQDGDLAPLAADQPPLLEGPEDFRDAGSPHSEHHRHQLVRKRERLAVHPVLGHQHPSATPLLDRVQAVAGHSMRNLAQESALIRDQELSERALPTGLCEQHVGTYSQGIARDLHDDVSQ